MRRISLLLGCLALLAAAFAVDRAGSLGPIPSPLAAGSQSAGEVQVPPPQGARASANVLAPFETIGSPYLRTTVGTYRVPLTPLALYAYYQPLLQHLGSDPRA